MIQPIRFLKCPTCGAEPSKIGELEEGQHPDEINPRAETWLAERKNWQAEVDALRASLSAEGQGSSKQPEQIAENEGAIKGLILHTIFGQLKIVHHDIENTIAFADDLTDKIYDKLKMMGQLPALTEQKTQKDWKPETLMCMEAYGDTPKDYPYEAAAITEQGEREGNGVQLDTFDKDQEENAYAYIVRVYTNEKLTDDQICAPIITALQSESRWMLISPLDQYQVPVEPITSDRGEGNSWNGRCKCGHLHTDHNPIQSHNYSAGRCKVGECRCSHFIHDGEAVAGYPQKVQMLTDYAQDADNRYAQLVKHNEAIIKDLKDQRQQLTEKDESIASLQSQLQQTQTALDLAQKLLHTTTEVMNEQAPMVLETAQPIPVCSMCHGRGFFFGTSNGSTATEPCTFCKGYGYTRLSPTQNEQTDPTLEGILQGKLWAAESEITRLTAELSEARRDFPTRFKAKRVDSDEVVEGSFIVRTGRYGYHYFILVLSNDLEEADKEYRIDIDTLCPLPSPPEQG